MVITILAEPRSGSTNFTNWFYKQSNFTVLFNPHIPEQYRFSKLSGWYQNGISPSDYKYKTKNLLIKLDYYHGNDYTDFINISDKIICLYRENEIEQIQSWVNAIETNNWDKPWIFNEIKNKNNEDFFKNLKKDFNEKFLNKNYFKVSYEELYYSNGIEKVIKYLNTHDVTNKYWPVGIKYRHNIYEINKYLL
jgi:hypothetical protein